MTALYTVASEVRQLLEQANPETGELPADLGERLAELEGLRAQHLVSLQEYEYIRAGILISRQHACPE